uniref:SMODS and SLOG-associating 2TM effector domain-containing protein n=1 Tax=Eutreptiella gymnastica TaxID=73025 RepID=A0A7S1JI72_9EUGL|mmetsp:Transcript_99802/g.171995  ORF Transcript_99802/g.171995 Transcript_99802/m.171995 type:complete len:1936 (+) Transcript_99802:120-5927(+)
MVAIHPVKKDEVKIEEEFINAGSFRQIRDEQPADGDQVVHRCKTTDHPDTVLRSLNLIGQVGHTWWQGVVRNVPGGKWRREERSSWRDAIYLKDGKKVFNRKDIVPGGIIHVLGDVNFERMQYLAERDEQHQHATPHEKHDATLDALQGFQEWKKQLPGKKGQVRADASGARVRPAHKDVQIHGVPVAQKAPDSDAAFTDPRKGLDDYGVLKQPANPAQISTLNSQGAGRQELASRVAGDEGVERDYASYFRGLLELDSALVPYALTERLDAEPEFITIHEKSRTLKQWLTRAIPGAALLTDSLIVYEREAPPATPAYMLRSIHNMHAQQSQESPDVASYLALGMLTKPGGRWVRQIGDQHELRLLGVQWDAGMAQSDERDPVHFFTHRLLVQQPASSKDTRAQGNVVAAQLALSSYTNLLIDWLAKGYRPEEQQQWWGKAPSRPQIPVVAVVVGGERATLKYRLQRYVDQGWPILLLQGSGGYADQLVSLVNAVRKQTQYPQYQKPQVLDGVEPLTAQIVANGRVVVVKAGMVASQVSRVIEQSLRGDSTLRLAWQTYLAWSREAERQEWWWHVLMTSILLTQVFTTAFAITLSFLELWWGYYPDANNSTVYVLISWSLMQLLVILLPILGTLLVAFDQRFGPGDKAVVLKTAASDLLKEIYLYRLSIRHYTRSKSSGDRNEKVLSNKLDELSQSLIGSDAAAVTLQDIMTLPAPPPECTVVGDDGFSDLNETSYVKYRLEPQMVRFSDKSVSAAAWKVRLTVGIFFFGALGSGLAALAAYIDESWLAWVAMTTCLVNTLSRTLDYQRYEWKQGQYNQTYQALTNVHTSFKSQGAGEQSLKQLQNLAGTAEDVISGTAHAEATQMGQAIQEQKNATEELTKEREQLIQEAQGKDEAAKMKALNLDGFSMDNLQKALLNPNGAEAASLKGMVVDLEKRMNGILEPVKSAVEGTQLGQELITEAKEQFEGVEKQATKFAQEALQKVLEWKKTFSLFAMDIVPDDIRHLLDDPRERIAFAERLQNGLAEMKSLGYNTLLNVAKDCRSELSSKMQGIGSRQLLSVTKQMLMQTLVDEFFGSDTKEVTDSVKEMLQYVTQGNKYEDFLSEMKMLSSAGALDLSFDAILNVVKDHDLKAKLFPLGRKKVTRLVGLAERLFDTDNNNKTFAMLNSVLFKTAAVDVQEMLDNSELAGQLWQTMAQVRKHGLQEVAAMAKSDLLQLFPGDILKLVEAKSQLQLQYYLKFLFYGTPSSRVWSEYINKASEMVPAGLRMKISQNAGLCESLVLSSKYIKQQDINTLSKGALVRAMRTSPHFSDVLATVLLQEEEEDLKAQLSAIQATIANSYSSRIMRPLVDHLDSVDLTGLFQPNEQSNLVECAYDFVYVDVEALTKPQILEAFTCKMLVQKLKSLSLEQLRELIHTFTFQRCNVLQLKALARVEGQVDIRNMLQDHAGPVHYWTDTFLDALLSAVDEQSVDKLPDMKETQQFFAELGSAQLAWGLAEFPKRDLYTLMKRLQHYSGDRPVRHIFQTVALDIADTGLYHKWIEAFVEPEPREAVFQVLQTLCHKSLKELLIPGLLRDVRQQLLTVCPALAEFCGADPSGQPHVPDSDLGTVLFLLTSEVQSSLAYLLWEEACQQLRTIDLEDLFPERRDRSRLIVWACDLLERAEPDMLTVLQNGLTDTDQEAVLEILPDSELFAAIQDGMQFLPVPQFTLIMNTVFQVLLHTPSGQFYCHYEKTRPEGEPEAREVMRLLDESLVSLKMKARLSPDELATSLGQFSVQWLHSKPAADRSRILAPLLEEERLVTELVASATEAPGRSTHLLEALFSHLREHCRPAAPSGRRSVQHRARERKVECLECCQKALSVATLGTVAQSSGPQAPPLQRPIVFESVKVDKDFLLPSEDDDDANLYSDDEGDDDPESDDREPGDSDPLLPPGP